MSGIKRESDLDSLTVGKLRDFIKTVHLLIPELGTKDEILAVVASNKILTRRRNLLRASNLGDKKHQRRFSEKS